MNKCNADPMDVIFPIPNRRQRRVLTAAAALTVSAIVAGGIALLGGGSPADAGTGHSVATTISTPAATTRMNSGTPTTAPRSTVTITAIRTVTAVPRPTTPAVSSTGKTPKTKAAPVKAETKAAPKISTTKHTPMVEPATKAPAKVVPSPAKPTTAAPVRETTETAPMQPTKAAVEAPTITPAPAPVKAAEQLGTTVPLWATVNANIRSGPGTEHSVVGGVSAGQQVTGRLVVGTTGWFKLGSNRYVAGSVVSTSKPKPAPKPAVSATTQAAAPSAPSRSAQQTTGGSTLATLQSYLPGPATIQLDGASVCHMPPSPGGATGCVLGASTTIHLWLSGHVRLSPSRLAGLIAHEYAHIAQGRVCGYDACTGNAAVAAVGGHEVIADCMAIIGYGARSAPGGYTSDCSGMRGDVARQILAGQIPQTASEQASGKPAAKAELAAAELQVHTEANSTSVVIATIPGGSALTVVGRAGGWMHVDLGGRAHLTGWVSG